MKYRAVHIILTAILSLTVVTSCTSGSPDVNSDKGAEMILTVGEISRSTVTTAINSFAIYGNMKFKDYDPSIIFDKTLVTYNKSDNRWNYGATQYWFPEHEYSFIAVYPADATEPEYSDSRISFQYTVPDNFESTHDLMIATHRRKMPEDNPSFTTDPVRLGFFHILSRIDFQVKNDKAADYVKVTEIKLIGINKTGSFSITPTSLSYGSEQTDDYISSWTDISNKGTLTADILVYIPEDKTVSLFPNDNALFMIPQPDNKDIIMEITYEQWDDGAKFEEHTLTATAPIGGWESGKVYTYSMSVSETTKDTYLTVSVKNWQGLNNSSGITVPEY